MPEITCTTHPAPPVAQAVSSAEAATRTYQVRTHGCQMNQHDSERLAGLLESAGYLDLAGVPESQRPASADVIVFNTCAVRENAANKLYGNLGQLRPAKLANPRLQIAVGGCLAQKEREEIQRRAPWVDVVFGTHNIGQLPVLLERARHNQTAQLEILESLETFPSMLPTRREAAYSGWVSISVGCNNTCTFCIVPALRGKEQDRAPEDVLAEVRALVASGVVEVTLLGQNVNSYGVQFGNRRAFSELLRACGDIEGLERVRFTSPHPAAFTDDVIDAMAATGNVMPSLHMPLQSGSDAVLKAMRRSYRAQKFLGILQRVREHLPDAAITTDIIVGFPGESDADFCATLEVVRQAQFASAFTFQYSIRPGTPAATMDQQIPKPVVQERYEELIRVQEQISWASNRAWEGRQVEVLVAAGEGRKDASTARLSGRAADNRLVHFALPPPARRQLESASARADHRSAASLIDPAWPRPGDLVTVGVTYGAPHHLVADTASAGGLFRVRRTAGGDAWEAAQGSPTGKPAVSLGLPAVGPPPQRRAAASGRQASPC